MRLMEISVTGTLPWYFNTQRSQTLALKFAFLSLLKKIHSLCNFAERISFAEHWELVAESSEFHLTLNRAPKAHFFQLEIRQKKRDILSEKRESGMVLKKCEFTPESGNVDT